MKEVYTFYLKQSIGEESSPVIKLSERVERGQLIAKKPDKGLGSHIYSSVSGEVTGIDDASISILADENQTSDYLKLSGQTPLELIEEAGIVGLGGAGFPTYVKLNHQFKNGGTILINAAECEPILEHNIRRIEESPEEIIEGISYILEITQAEQAIIAYKDKHATSFEGLKRFLPDNISLKTLPDMYPAGDERAVIRECLGVLIDVDQLPLVADAIVVNVETVYRIYEAIALKKPLIDKDITIAGKLKDSGKIEVKLDLPLGMQFGDIFTLVGGIGSEYGEIVEGGPYMGKRTQLDRFLSKTTGGLIAAETFWKGPEKLGMIICACGASLERMHEIAASMGSEVVDVQYCKQAIKVKGGLKCENPGICPGQVEKVLALKKAGAEGVLISHCTDCTNTVMASAPKMNMKVYHGTDGSLRACNIRLIRKAR